MLKSYLIESMLLIRLAGPVLIASLAGVLMTTCDTAMAGHSSTSDQTIVSVASGCWTPIFSVLQAILSNFIPIIAKLRGEDQATKIRAEFWQGIWISLVLSLFTVALLSICSYIAQDPSPMCHPSIRLGVKGYLRALQWGCPGYFLFCILKAFTDGCAQTHVGMKVGFLGLLINIPLNYLFIYGKLGVPKLGGVGSGVASAMTYWLMALLMTVELYRNRHFYYQTVSPKLFHPIWPDQKLLYQQLSRGGMQAFAQFFEVTTHSLVIILLLCFYGEEATSAHEIAGNVCACLYAFPSALGVATTIRLGCLLGVKAHAYNLKRLKTTSLYLGTGLGALNALILFLFATQLTHLYSRDPAVVHLASRLLFYAILSQIPDAINILAVSVLRAYQDLGALFLINLVAYWGLSFPVGCFLGLSHWIPGLPLGATGFWGAFILGSHCAAYLCWCRLRKHPEPDPIPV